MLRLRRTRTIALVGSAALCLSMAITNPALAGQPGVSAGNENALMTPGRSISAKGSPFNPEGRAGEVYAGNPETASLAHAASEHAVSQYDIACVQVSK
jgi:hypothetical protein